MTYKPLRDTSRCHLFEDIADEVWNWIVDGVSVGVDEDECGITKKIIIKILKHRNAIRDNFDVFVKPGWREPDFGSDIDVFVEVSPNQFHWFAMQAKLVKANNRYDKLRDGSDSEMQWKKLERLQRVSGCTPYYLLYNGSTNASLKNLKDCAGPFSVSQYGCSLAEPFKIAQLAQKKNNSDTRFINPTFEDIHPNYAVPWRMLTCCLHKGGNPTLYTSAQIQQSNYNFIDISDYTTVSEIAESVPSIQFIQQGTLRGSEIDIYAKQAGWNPDVRIMINQTQSL
jgi:hypothetical protein